MEGPQSCTEKGSSWTEEAKQSKSCTDHLHHHPRHHSLRYSGWGWALRLRFWRSVLGKGLGLAVWRQPEGLGSGATWAGEQKTTAEGTWEEVWAHRRSKVPLLGKVRGGGVDHHRNLPMHVHMGSQRAGCLWCRLWVVRSLLLRLRETRHFLCRL